MWEFLKAILPAGAKSAPQHRNRYILVVDDSDVERTFYRKTLEKAGYEVLAASNGQTAIDSLERRQPNLIISDLYMPEMNGKEMCQRIKARETTKDIPLIFLTGSARPGEVVDCFDVGGEYYLEKPIDARALIRQVDTILSDLDQEGSACACTKE